MPVKRKLLPLLGIAFAVAVVATGIFYGLIAGKLKKASSAGPQRAVVVAARNLEPGAVVTKADTRLVSWSGAEAPKGAFTSVEQVVGLTAWHQVQENEPLIRTRLASREGGGGAAAGVPEGMRAVSIHVPDSPGVVRLLQPGSKIDIQVVRTRGARSGEADLRTVLEAVPVLAVSPEGGGRNSPGPVLTVLARPHEAEMLGVADAAARLQVVLRNPLDQERTTSAGVDLISLFQDRPAAARRTLRASAAPSPPAEELGLEVRIARAHPDALGQWRTGLVSVAPHDQLQVSAFRPGWDLEGSLRKLEAGGQVRVVSRSALRAGHNRQVGVEAGSAATCGVELRFQPWITSSHRLRLRVQPLVSLPSGGSLATRRLETELELASGQSFLVSGLVPLNEKSCLAGSGDQDLVVLVTPWLAKLGQPAPHSAVLQKP